MTEDSRAQMPNICGISYIGPTGIEWICVKLVHDIGYTRRGGTLRGSNIAYGTGAHPERSWAAQIAPSDRHHFINRYPNRLVKEK